LENVLIAVGNVELSNKMVSHLMDEKVFAIKTSYSSGGSCAAVERQYQEFSAHVAPS
jgi:hypothetical protein